MLEIHQARAEELPRLRELWTLAFGDRGETLDLFFGACLRTGELLTLTEGGEPVSMLVLLPTGLRGAGEETLLPYVYALCTHPDRRGEGYAGMLMSYAAFRAEEMGSALLSTVPAEESLHRFFGREGFREAFAHWERRFLPGELKALPAEGILTPLGAEAYLAMREELLAGQVHVTFPRALAALQEQASLRSGGGLYRLELPGGVGCAAVERWEDRVTVKELLCPGGTPEGCGLLSRQFPGQELLVRTPLCWAGPGGEERAFGMVRPLRGPGAPASPPERAYLGLAFD